MKGTTMTISFIIFLAAWFALAGGGGCGGTGGGGGNPDPVHEPFFCNGLDGTYHWAERKHDNDPSFTVFAHTTNGVRDAEWNGLNDGNGPACTNPVADIDESDPLDPHAQWFYRIDPAGFYVSDNWTLDCPPLTICRTSEWPRIDYLVTAGQMVAYSLDSFPALGSTLDSRAQLRTFCDDGSEPHPQWVSWSGAPLPTFTVPAGATECQAELFFHCDVYGGEFGGTSRNCMNTLGVWKP